jgi:hypothetical protein
MGALRGGGSGGASQVGARRGGRWCGRVVDGGGGQEEGRRGGEWQELGKQAAAGWPLAGQDR